MNVGRLGWGMALAGIVAVGSAWAADTAAVGHAAPEFQEQDAGGRSRSLADFRGKIVVLEWFNPECPFVKKHYDSGNMQQLQKRATDQGVAWLTVSSSAEGKQGHVTAEQAVEILAQRKAAPTALLLDGDGSTGRLYGARTTPHMFVIDKDGVLVYNGAIDSKAGVDPADIPESTNYVQAALDQVAAGQPVTTSTTQPYGCSVKY